MMFKFDSSCNKGLLKIFSVISEAISIYPFFFIIAPPNLPGVARCPTKAFSFPDSKFARVGLVTKSQPVKYEWKLLSRVFPFEKKQSWG